MKRTSLIRLGGLAAMIGGVLYVLQTYLVWPLVRMSDTELNPRGLSTQSLWASSSCWP
jgi:hypothetical protein